MDRDLVQTCIFGMGVMAQKMPSASYPLNDVLLAIKWTYSMEFKTERGLRAECCENATSTLAKCVYYHGDVLPSLTEIVSEGLCARMPLTTDTEEAQACHTLFF